MSAPSSDRILDSALDLFIRHGFRRTTMGDIAGEAAMSRPALYLVYRNKEQIFRAVCTRYCAELKRLGSQRISARSGLGEKLAAALKTWITEPYRLISRSPEAGELHEIAFSFADDLRELMRAEFEAQLLDVMRSAPEVDPKALKDAGLELPAIASLIAHSAPQLKRTVASGAELERHLDTLRRIHVAVLTGRTRA